MTLTLMQPDPVSQEQTDQFARVLYIGEVPVENTRAGSVQLYRLLRRHPADHLRLIETGRIPSAPALRLPDVRYSYIRTGASPWRYTRFRPLFEGYLFLKAPFLADRI